MAPREKGMGETLRPREGFLEGVTFQLHLDDKRDMGKQIAPSILLGVLRAPSGESWC